jgi:hypothetical protein
LVPNGPGGTNDYEKKKVDLLYYVSIAEIDLAFFKIYFARRLNVEEIKR